MKKRLTTKSSELMTVLVRGHADSYCKKWKVYIFMDCAQRIYYSPSMRYI